MTVGPLPGEPSPTVCVAGAPPVRAEVESDVNQAAETDEYQAAVDAGAVEFDGAVLVTDAVEEEARPAVSVVEAAADVSAEASALGRSSSTVDPGDALSVTRSSSGRMPLR